MNGVSKPVDHLALAKTLLHVPNVSQAHALIAVAEELRRNNERAEYRDYLEDLR